MYKLLRAGFRRYMHSKLFWLGVLASLCIGVLGYFEMFQTDPSFETYRVIAGFLICTILIAVSIGKEFHNGGFRNKVVAGFGKDKIFFSEWILAILSSLLCFIAISIPVAIIDIENIYSLTATNAFKIIVGMLFVNISVAVISYTVCMIVSNRVVAPIICIFIILGAFVLTSNISSRLQIPKHQYYYEYNEATGEMDEYLSKEINQRYIDEPLRTVFGMFTKAVPEGHVDEYLDIINEACGYADIDYDKDRFIPYKLSDEQLNILNTYPLYSLATISIFSFIGFIVFRRKGLK